MIGTNDFIKLLLDIGHAQRLDKQAPDFAEALLKFNQWNPGARPSESQVNLARISFEREFPGSAEFLEQK